MKLLSTLIFVLVSVTGIAHEGHNHEAAVEPAPLGGILRDAPPFKSEIVIDNETVKLYIYDQKLKVVKFDKDTLKGDIQFPREKAPKAISFKRTKSEKPKTIKDVGEITEHYEAKIPNIKKAHRYDLHVQLDAGGKTAKVDFGVDNIH